jgi:DNA ligase-1
MAINVMLAKKYEPTKHKILGWYMSEKLDGVRAVWNGHAFVTRNGNILNAPWRVVGPMKKLTELIGANHLDGELYMGRGAFNECSGTVRRNEDEWIGIEFHIFDIVGPQEIFFKRHRLLEDLSRRFPKFVRLVDQRSVATIPGMTARFEEITKAGGEGLMLKNPASHYQFKRSSDLLKVKTFEECEAVVIGYENGLGKYTGMVGALKCRLPNGNEFSCGSGLVDSERLDYSLFDGKTITVKYFELSKDGIPRFPIFKGIRTDV